MSLSGPLLTVTNLDLIRELRFVLCCKVFKNAGKKGIIVLMWNMTL